MPSVITVPTNSYITLSETDTYLDDSIHGVDTWGNQDTNTKTRAILTSFRIIERQDYLGAKVGTEKWPRTGLTDEEGNAVPSSSVPLFVKRAQYELSLELVINPNFQNKLDASDNIKELKAGSAAITKFRRKSGSRFPQIINEYLGRYLEGGMNLILPVAGGIDTVSGISTYHLNQGY